VGADKHCQGSSSIGTEQASKVLHFPSSPS
jgi:hypothetical protein